MLNRYCKDRLIILIKMTKYDLHAHLFTSWETGKFSLERGSREVGDILDVVKNEGLKGIALTCFEDYRFEEFAASARSEFGKYRLVRELSNALTFTDGEEAIRIIRAQEIPTREGEVLALAGNSFDRIQKEQGLKETLEKIANSGAIAIAVHPAGYGGIGKVKLTGYGNLFHAYEKFNANFQPVLLAGLPGISVSDCYNRKDLGNGYIEIEKDFDFSSEDNLISSIKEALASRRFKPVVKKEILFAQKRGMWQSACMMFI